MVSFFILMAYWELSEYAFLSPSADVGEGASSTHKEAEKVYMAISKPLHRSGIIIYVNGCSWFGSYSLSLLRSLTHPGEQSSCAAPLPPPPH